MSQSPVALLDRRGWAQDGAARHGAGGTHRPAGEDRRTQSGGVFLPCGAKSGYRYGSLPHGGTQIAHPLPLLPAATGLDFDEAYIIISWLCWVPNIIVAELIIRKLNLHLAV